MLNCLWPEMAVITLTELLHVVVFINYTSDNMRYLLSHSLTKLVKRSLECLMDLIR